jgi:hypothetical protein
VWNSVSQEQLMSNFRQLSPEEIQKANDSNKRNA